MLLAANGSTPARLAITTNVDLLYYALFYRGIYTLSINAPRVLASRAATVIVAPPHCGVGGLAALRRTRPSVSNLPPPSSRCIYIAAGVGGWAFLYDRWWCTGSVFGVILAEMTTLSTDSRTTDRTGRTAVIWLFGLLLAYLPILLALS
jgi:hypothetical protein